MMRLWPLLLPELRQFPEGQRQQALGAARETAFDILELLGMAAGLVAVTALTRYSLADTGGASRVGAAVLNFVVALPLLAVAIGPFQVRRLRRGLRQQLSRQSSQQLGPREDHA